MSLETIIIAEDSKGLLDTFVEMLEIGGITDIRLARNGLEAWNIAQELQKFRAMFSDLSMPEIRGDELLERIKFFDPTIRRVLTSSAAPLQSELDRAEPHVFLRKPFTIPELFTALDVEYKTQ